MLAAGWGRGKTEGMSSYVYAQVEIVDREGFRGYTALFAPTLQPFAGRVLAVSDAPDVLEGPWPDGRSVLLEFPTAEKARAWYESDGYQEISVIRRKNSTASMVVLPGFD